MMIDTNAYPGKYRELRGLHISSINVILAAFFDKVSGVFEIGTIDFANS
jgi:hypothetical protein